VLATTHPSAVLRARNDRAAAFDALVDDLRVAAAALS
jgi:DNA polymerase